MVTWKSCKENMNIFIVIPAFNESRRIGKVLDHLKSVGLQIIIVDDGSSDSTYNIAKKHQVTTLIHKVNLGKGAALKTGCEAAFLMGADAVIMMDSDGQHKIEDLPKFVNALQERKFDIIFGSRNLRLGVPMVRFIGNKMASVLVNLLFGIYISDLICGYRAFTKEAFKKLDWESPGYGLETEMVIKTGVKKLKYCEVSVETVYYDKFKGVTIMDAFSILCNVIKWRIFK